MFKQNFLICLLLININLFAQMPFTYDLRNVNGENYVTAVKSQQGGTCWTHGTMSSMESNLVMTGNWLLNGESGEPDLAEYHLDWWCGYNSYYNQDLDPPFDNNQGLEVHYGGDYRVVTAYMSRLDGAVREQDGQSYSTPPYFDHPFYHHYYPMHVEWYNAGPNLENINIIKQKIIDYGVMATCMCYDNSFMDGINHYQPPGSNYEPNHSVAIIGWNDFHNTQAPQAGAWLVKNSWGSDWGDDGYFWISYYDKHACQNPEMGAISFIDVDLMQWDTAYYYDYHGWRDTLKNTNEAFNAFTANSDEEIVAISFFTADDDINYTAKIYGDFDGTILSNELSVKSGNFLHSGMHTVILDDTVSVSSYDSFYVYLELDKGGFAYDRTSEVPVLLGADTRVIVPSTAAPEQSYYMNDDKWLDFYDYNDPSGFQNTGNICIKAIANHDYGVGIGQTFTEDEEFYVYPNPFIDKININYISNNNSITGIIIHSIDGKIVFQQTEKTYLNSQFSIDVSKLVLESGIYFVSLIKDGNPVATKKIIKN